MKGKHILTVAALCCLPFSTISAADNLDEAAADLCKCFGDSDTFSAELLEALKAAKANGDFTSLMPFQDEMMNIMNSFETCFEGLPAKYPEVNSSPELQQQVMAMAEESCPNPAAFMMNQ